MVAKRSNQRTWLLDTKQKGNRNCNLNITISQVVMVYVEVRNKVKLIQKKRMTKQMKMCCTSTPAPDPVVSDPLGAYSLPSQATDGLVAMDIDPHIAILTVFGDCVFPATSEPRSSQRLKAGRWGL